jgi:hypothetical protein
MKSVVIKNSELEIFNKILNNGYAIEDGRATRRIIRELKQADVPLHHGYAQNTKKVIIALESPLTIVERRRSFTRTRFDLNL